ncbi:small subunit ribosomal protein S18 [Naegleria gruberi]|uniref:Small subunit ribosomal protein S18 n=1 Tax=Naegleria gruberi TaxID=5762 RepID=D2UZS5_NAEGR|nr:small subunit ribosomal protein S18 [Naegleria gruberi]EFC50213.1 small subunit ribosomal protein S18 [Naegleria gruberi]|eukprot:XP_002682957.1 small subunit ribosomal protein S18 [Naegleria gruberi strain NEG-M]
MKRLVFPTVIVPLKGSSTKSPLLQQVVFITSNSQQQQFFHQNICKNDSVRTLHLDEAAKRRLSKKKLSAKDMHKLIEDNITKIRGGRANYDGSDVYEAATRKSTSKQINPESPFYAQTKSQSSEERSSMSGQASTWYDYYRFIERADSDVFNHDLKTPTNANTAGWLYNKPPTGHTEFMNTISQFTDVVQDWREGKLTGDDMQHRKMMEYQLHQLPQFKTRPPDPFGNNQHYIEKISYKNPSLLLKFVSQSGRIIPKRFTGVRRRTHKRIETEVKKARFLGLLSYTGGSLEQGNLLNQIELPNVTTKHNLRERTEIMLTKSQQIDNTKYYLDNLAKNISTTGTIEWIPPEKNGKNPRTTVRKEKAQLEGHLKSQVEKKKALIQKLRVENEILQKKKSQQ